VTTRDAHPRVEHFVSNEYRGDLRVELVAVDDNFGSADMLRAVKEQIRTVRRCAHQARSLVHYLMS
jgi:hypothetical protein